MKPRIPTRRRARVRKVLAALAELQAYDDGRRANGDEPYMGEVDTFLNHHLFRWTFDEWKADRVRALVLAACINAPDAMLKTWAEEAGKALEDHAKMLADIDDPEPADSLGVPS